MKKLPKSLAVLAVLSVCAVACTSLPPFSDDSDGEKYPERGIYLATHFGNWYVNASPQEIEDYLGELKFWGCRTVSAWFDMHSFSGMDDPEAVRLLATIKLIFAKARALEMEPNLLFLANESFNNSPAALRADWKPGHNGYTRELCGHYHVEICPSKPGGTELILKMRTQVLDAFADEPPASVTIFPYDQGGCTCAQCAPWGAKAYLVLSEKLAELCREKFSDVKIHLSTWDIDTFGPKLGEWDGIFAQKDRIRKWADVIYVRDHDLAKMDAQPFLPYISMSEISMHGANPWGGYGANPQPQRLQKEISRHPKCAGLRPYSEGIYEDMNKVMVLAVLSGRATNTMQAVRQYAERYFGEGTGDDVCEAAALFERNQGRCVDCAKEPLAYATNSLPQRAMAEQALAAVERAERKMADTARESWRWRIFRIRAEIDLSASKGEPPLAQRENFAELGRIYHVGPGTEGAVCPPTVELNRSRPDAAPGVP